MRRSVMLNTARVDLFQTIGHFVEELRSEGKAMTGEEIARVDIAASRELVWQALTRPELISNWFGWDSPGLGEEVEMIFGSAVKDEARGTIDFGEWQGVADHFEISGDSKRTTVVVTRTGDAPSGGWGAVHDEVIEGWISFIQQLRLYLEQHRSDVRRTLWLSSKTGPGPIAAIGLIGAGGVGERYTRELAPGDAVSGEVWHWGRHQIGVQVEEWNGGLVIAGDRPGGGGTALLTVYGVSDADFEGIETRWRTFWSATYPAEASK
jgi:uncharacterized protein YndB with AHSA1/START domain